MRVRVRLFAALKDLAGRAWDEVELPPGSTVADLATLLAQRHPRLRDGPRAVYAVNGDYAPADRTLEDGDEVALIPPVSGGAAAAPPAQGRLYSMHSLPDDDARRGRNRPAPGPYRPGRRQGRRAPWPTGQAWSSVPSRPPPRRGPCA